MLFTATVVKTHINVFHLPFLKMFKEAGWEVHVAAKNDFVDEPCVIPNCDKYYDIDFDRFPFSRKNFYAYRKLKNIILENQYDIVHCNTPVAGVLTRLAARLCNNTKVIYTAHGFHFFKGAPLINWILYYPIERFCARFTDKLITINEEDYNIAKNWGLKGNGKVYLVNGVGIDIDKFKNSNVNVIDKKQSLGISKNCKILLSVGELNKNKNHEVIIKALSFINKKDYIYLICGRGILENKLKHLIVKFKLENNIKLLGYRNDIFEILKIADAFIFPSKREGLPVSLIEALVSGVYCLASDIRGNRELLTAEQRFNYNNIFQIKEMIEEILEKKENRIFYSKFDDSKYDINNILKRMKEIYELKG